MGLLYVHITNTMQALYAHRGMWINGQAQGVLAGMLGPKVLELSDEYRQTYWVTPEQLASLWRDLSAIPMEGRQRGQFLRRLREAVERAGLDVSEVLEVQPGAQSANGARPAIACQSAAKLNPLEPLVLPVSGKAAKLFSEAVWRTTQEFIEFTQSSEYLHGDQS